MSDTAPTPPDIFSVSVPAVPSISAVAMLPNVPTPSSASATGQSNSWLYIFAVIIPVPIRLRLGLNARLLSAGLIFSISLSSESGEIYSKTRATLPLRLVEGRLPGRGPTRE
jgi:hypothetical protein